MTQPVLTGHWSPVLHRRQTLQQVRRIDRSHSREARARFVRGLVLCLAFALVLGTAWLIQVPGTRALLKREAGIDLGRLGPDRLAPWPEDNGKRPGRLVFELPDGVSCRYVPFDNITGWIGENMTAECADAVDPDRAPARQFSWGK